MKKLNKIWGSVILTALLFIAAPIHSKAQEGGYISDQQFYDDLDPYGTWVSDPQYGNVWVPDAEDGFRPYATRGHWVVTDYGNTWVSDYQWGWAPFHYGRWRYDDYYGWEWIPGHEWAPAWVSWRHGGGYYGWAPLQPGITISVSIGGGYRAPDNYWVCAPEAYINRPNIYNYYVPHTRAVTIIRNTTIINNTYVNNNRTYIAGPRVEDIRRVTHQNVQVYRINNESRPSAVRVQNNTVNIYRPAVNKVANARPNRVIDGAAYRQQNPNQAIAHRGGGAPAYNKANAARLAQAARAPKPDARVVHVNPITSRPAIEARQQQAQQRQQEQQQRTQQQAQQRQKAQQRTQQQADQRKQQAQQRSQQQEQARHQQTQQRQQQQEQARQQRQQQQEQARQLQAQQRQQQQEQARQQRAQQHQQQQEQARQQQAQQRQQQQEQARQQQAQQRQQQQEQARQQQAQQRQQQQEQARQQQAQQRQQQQAQQRQQQAQQRQQQAQQRQQQQAQQRQQQAQQRQQQQRPERPPHHE